MTTCNHKDIRAKTICKKTGLVTSFVCKNKNCKAVLSADFKVIGTLKKNTTEVCN